MGRGLNWDKLKRREVGLAAEREKARIPEGCNKCPACDGKRKTPNRDKPGCWQCHGRGWIRR